MVQEGGQEGAGRGAGRGGKGAGRRPRGAGYSSPLIPASLITLPSRAMSPLMTAAACSGVLLITSVPMPVRRPLISWVCSTLLISALSLLTMAEGVRAGAKKPLDVVNSKPGTPWEATVGMSGNSVDGCAVVTP